MSNWRTEVIPPAEMSTEMIRAELRHDIDVYGSVRSPISSVAMAARINALVEEMDKRVAGGSDE